MAFNRDRNKQGGFRSRPSFSAKGGPASGWGGRPRFGDRGDRGPVEMHKAICDNCGRECEVPFRPTQGKPVFCSNCFERKGISQSQRSESQDWNPRRSNSDNRDSSGSQLRELNAKLDKILELLTPSVTPEALVASIAEKTPTVKKKRKSSKKTKLPITSVASSQE